MYSINIQQVKVKKYLSLPIYQQIANEIGKCIPEVSWVGLLLEGMEGFPSPFESLRTILWY